MLQAICCTTFFGLKLGELLSEVPTLITSSASLMWGNVAMNSWEKLTLVRVHLKRSKCDLFGAGADIILGRNVSHYVQ